jgi:nucleotide-binding universal stress UspA family protein
MYQKILVPLDGSEFAECALEHVKAIALGCKVPEVVLLNVIRPIPTQIPDVRIEVGHVPQEWLVKTEKENQAEAQKYISSVAKKLNSEGITAKGVTVKADPQARDPAKEILDYVSKNQVDLIIMTTHGQSGISRWWFGTVADRIVRHSTAPVLIVAPPGCRTNL